MVRRCIVPYCKTKYAKKKKISIFRVPNDKLKQWQKAIGINLTCNDHVCAKHFSEKHIIRIIKTNVYSYELKIPRLTPDAVPSIFPEAFEKSCKKQKIDINSDIEEEHCTLNETTDDPEEANNEDESPSLSDSIDDSEDSIIINDDDENLANDSDDCILLDESSDEANHSNDCTISNNSKNIFEQCILSDVTQQDTTETNWLYDLSMGIVSLPDSSWAIHSITNGDDPLALPSICLTKMIIENDQPLTKFNIVITNNIIKYFIFNQQIHTMNVEDIKNLRAFENLIYKICNVECCYGVEEPLIPTNFKSPFYRIDPLLNRWRHIYCSYIIDDMRYQICSNCKKIFLAVYQSGRKLNPVNGNQLLNVRRKLLVMQKRMRIRNQNVVNEMIKCKRKIGQINNDNKSIYTESRDNLNEIEEA